ncbi:MAG TPA: LysR family transcriptional regulator [Acetobacteraceae bacterium]|nr:LysR family transcriptional regulator [Acetobacteraceae bacterium]
MPDLRELRYFAAAARAGNLARAAQELNVTAAAVSQQLRKLEETLGTPLLLRHGRGVAATPTGLRLLDRIDTILRLLSAPLELPPAHAAPEGTVSLAMPPELGALLASPVATLVRHRWPELTLDLRDGPDSAVEALCAGQMDIALLADPPALDALLIEPVATERLGLVVSPRDALADSTQPLRLRDLLAVPLILPGKRHWIRRRLAKAAFQRGLRFDAVTQVDSLPMTRAMVRDGLGCTILPHAAVQEDTDRGALVFRPLEQPELPVTYAIATPGDAHPLLREMAHVAAEAIRSLAGTTRWPDAQPSSAPAHGMRDRAASADPQRQPAQPQECLEFAEGD